MVKDGDPEGAGVDLSLIEHISPITLSDVILYGVYVLDRDRVQL